METVELEERKDVIVHGSPVHAMCIGEAMGKMIVARKIEGGDDILEQFNILPGWLAVQEKLICPGNGSIESITFVDNKILSTHINGSIVISDPHSDTIRRVQICPSPLWSCCAINKSQVALVSHSAMLYCFNCDECAVEKSLSLGIDNRLFSVAAKGDEIAIGGQGIVFIVKNGTLKHSLTVGRKDRRLPTIVWTVLFMKNGIVVSGDSRGCLCFWNPKDGALLMELNSHQADILSICLKDDVICAAGVDPRIMTIREVGKNDFHVISKRNGPVRDVKALASCDDRVYAVGDDHEIYVGSQGCTTVKRQMNKMIILGGRLAMAKGYNYIDLYTSGEGEEDTVTDEIIVAKQPIYLARIMTPGKLPLTACDLSSDGSLIALSTMESTTVYRINNKRKKQAIERLPLQARPATAVKVLKDSLILASGDFELHKIPLEENGMTEFLEQTGCGIVTQLAVSSCERYAAVITSRLEVFAIDFKNSQSRPVRVDLPIDIAFTDNGSLFVLTAIAGFDNPDKTKKILFEFPAAGGAVQRSISAASLFQSGTGAANVRPVSISPGPGNRLLVLGHDGQWVIINKSRKDVLPYSPSSHSAVLPSAVHFRSAARVCCCRVEMPPPETAPFNLKKFQTQ